MTDPTADWTPLPSVDTLIADGRAARRSVPRSALSRLTGGSDRDPLGILDRQNATRVQSLVPLRTERMSQSAFAFYRGTAALMAADLARDPHSGILVPSCGDAHVANFGFYGSPQRTLVFDLNDFDEAAWAPWEWDVKRLVTSIVIAGRATTRDPVVVQDAALAAVRAYARAIVAAARETPLARYFSHLDVRGNIDQLDDESRRALRAAIRDAEKRTGDRAARRLTAPTADGRLEFVENPPSTTHTAPEVERRLAEFVNAYAQTANVDIRMLLRNYVPADSVRRVVGVGSVGTRCYLVALQDGDGGALILQAKEAGRSVLVEYGGIEQPADVASYIEREGQGGRVVALQRILQAFSDPFLGHLTVDGVDLYVRQFHDMKGGLDIETLEDVPFARYAQSCAITLARAHGQSPNAATVAGYIGNGRLIGEALLEWAQAYADVSQADYDAFVAAHPAP
ncbi:MAG: DUF2252 domain-containing protein [Microbacterium sp.]|uniref:DUF2252 domain-containing protein n=1 Tax=Microbacterium sp. TaxID=51671 RepID=UPI001AC3E550|nr:DUF2252 family protein [Microbacterium sp.]MBN9154065.1 DUF2252 domain-containing protein [Microbacterium sp.]MBN9174023.1 DUF2252 domain-containing protein [Microbacterium sp.]